MTSSRSAAAGSPPRSPGGRCRLGTVVGHGVVEVGDETEPVENDDYASFSASFADSAAVGVVQVSRVAAGHPNGLAIEVFGDRGRRAGAGAARRSPADVEGRPGHAASRRAIVGPDHPAYVAGGLPMDAPGVSLGQNDGFVYPGPGVPGGGRGNRRGSSLPRCASFAEGVHNLEILLRLRNRLPSALASRFRRSVPRATGREPAMKFGVYNAILHDRPLPEAIEVVARLGLTGIEAQLRRIPARDAPPEDRSTTSWSPTPPG